MRRSLVFVVLLACGCGGFLSAFGEDPEPETRTEAADAAADGANAALDANGSSNVDATGGGDGSSGEAGDGGDGGKNGTCVIVGPTFGAPWTSYATAELKPANVAKLCDESLSTTGLIVAPGLHEIGRVRVSFDFVVSMSSVNAPGAGFTFMWSTANPIRPGSGDQDLGACGLPSGFAVAFLDKGDISLRPLIQCSLASPSAQLQNFVDGLARHVDIEIDNAGHARVFVDQGNGAPAIPTLESDFPAWSPLNQAWVGFSAATGASEVALHTVRDVKIEFPDEPPCP